jgi:hypothetical protein
VIFASFCADPFFLVAGRVGSPSRPDCGEVVGSGVANVDGPLGDRTLPKATQRFYREASHSPKRRLLGKRGCASQPLFIAGAARGRARDDARVNIDNYFFRVFTKRLTGLSWQKIGKSTIQGNQGRMVIPAVREEPIVKASAPPFHFPGAVLTLGSSPRPADIQKLFVRVDPSQTEVGSVRLNASRAGSAHPTKKNCRQCPPIWDSWSSIFSKP